MTSRRRGGRRHARRGPVQPVACGLEPTIGNVPHFALVPPGSRAGGSPRRPVIARCSRSRHSEPSWVSQLTMGVTPPGTPTLESGGLYVSNGSVYVIGTGSCSGQTSKQQPSRYRHHVIIKVPSVMGSCVEPLNVTHSWPGNDGQNILTTGRLSGDRAVAG